MRAGRFGGEMRENWKKRMDQLKVNERERKKEKQSSQDNTKLRGLLKIQRDMGLDYGRRLWKREEDDGDGYGK